MPDVPDLHLQQIYTGPDGNMAVHHVKVDLPVADANTSYFAAPLARGMRIYNVVAVVTNAANSSTTFRVGLKQKGTHTGDDDFTNDNDALITASSLAAVAEFESRAINHHAPIDIKQPDMYLTIDNVTAITDAAVVQLTVEYSYEGNL